MDAGELLAWEAAMGATVATGHRAFSDRVVESRSTPLDRWMLGRITHSLPGVPVCLRLWDGTEIQTEGPPIATIEFKNRRALQAWVLNPDLNVGETYMFGAVEIHGHLVGLLEAINRSVVAPPAWRRWHWPNTREASRHNVHHHYDLGNAFYRLWLDGEMQYSCAYYPTPAARLEDAQVAKLDLVCRKMRLQPGERVIEAGCGWGSLALHMARRYGVTVKAFNISTEQLALARERARAERLTGRVEFIEDDYRNVNGRFDVLVSVGMLEHVGLAEYPAFSRVINRVLTPEGRGLLHFIGRDRPAPLNAWIRHRIFPGAYPPTLGEVSARILEPAGCSVLDVENLRQHYALTLKEWLARFEAHAGDVQAMFDEPFVRAWRLYLAGSQAAFTTGWLQLFQIVFARGTSNAIPWTRVSG
jgi:cyclopropane-fatty-acyl-phospholipid synthase